MKRVRDPNQIALEFAPILQGLRRLLETSEILEPHISPALDFLGPKYSHFSFGSEKVLLEADRLARETPDLAVSAGRSLISVSNAKTLLLAAEKTGSVYEKAKYLSSLWELASVLRLPAHLLSGRKAGFERLVLPPAILRHFKDLGLSSKHRETVRILRNGISHRFHTEPGKFIFVDDSGRRYAISFAEIEESFRLQKDIFEWWVTLALVVIPWAVPRFGILALIGLGSELRRSGKDFSKYLESLSAFHPEIFRGKGSGSIGALPKTEDPKAARGGTERGSLKGAETALGADHDECLRLAMIRLTEVGNWLSDVASASESEQALLIDAAGFFEGFSRFSEGKEIIESGIRAAGGYRRLHGLLKRARTEGEAKSATSDWP